MTYEFHCLEIFLYIGLFGWEKSGTKGFLVWKKLFCCLEEVVHKMLPVQIFVGHISFFSQKTSCIVRNSSGIYVPLSGRFYQIEKYPGKNMYKYKFMQIGYWKCPITIPVLLTRTGICTQHSGSGQFGTRTCHPCSSSSLNFEKYFLHSGHLHLRFRYVLEFNSSYLFLINLNRNNSSVPVSTR